MFEKLTAAATNLYSTTKYTLKKHTPEILSVTGVGLLIGAGVLACKETLKATEIIDNYKKGIEAADAILNDPNTSEESRKIVENGGHRAVAMRTAFRLAKNYAPAAALATCGAFCVFASNDILRKRSAALAAAYVAVDKSFSEYRKRVIDKYGAEVDEQLMLGTHTEEVEEVVVDESGNEKVVKKTYEVADPNLTSPYAVYFRKYLRPGVVNSYWDDDDFYISKTIDNIQNYATDKLITEGSVTLNYIYSQFNLPVTKAGLVVGWKKNSPNGDNKVEITAKKVYIRDEDGNLEKAYALDFNVDGSIYENFEDDTDN